VNDTKRSGCASRGHAAILGQNEVQCGKCETHVSYRDNHLQGFENIDRGVLFAVSRTVLNKRRARSQRSKMPEMICKMLGDRELMVGRPLCERTDGTKTSFHS